MIVWWSGWEVANLEVDGREVKFGTPESDAMLLERMEQMYRAAAPARREDRDPRPIPRSSRRRSSRSRTPPRTGSTGTSTTCTGEFAAAPSAAIVVVDLSERLCPGLVCPEIVDGFKPRPHDGMHFSPGRRGVGGAVALAADPRCRTEVGGLTSAPWLLPTGVIPVLVCEDIAATHDFLVEVFGFASGGVMRDGDGQPVHGEVRAGDAAIWLHRASPDHGLASPGAVPVASSGLVVYVDDVDEHHRHAGGSGAVIESEPTDQDYGQREYGARDPEGHRFWFATRTSRAVVVRPRRRRR